MPIANDMPLALANRFTVKVDAPGEIDLGSWAKVDGLDVTFDVVDTAPATPGTRAGTARVRPSTRRSSSAGLSPPTPRR